MQSTPTIFHQSFENINHKYSTKYFNNNFIILSLTVSKFAISVRGPLLWNKFLKESTKYSPSFTSFKQFLKRQLHEYENEMSLFQ